MMIRAEIWRKGKEGKEEELKKKEVELEKERKLAEHRLKEKELLQEGRRLEALKERLENRRVKEENTNREDDGLWNGCLVDTHCHLPKVLR